MAVTVECYENPHLCEAGSEQHTFIQLPHPLQEFVNIWPLKNVHLVHSSIYLNRNHKVSIADGLQKKWLVMRHLFHITIILTQLTHSMKQNHS